MADDPIPLTLASLVSSYVLYLWIKDYRAQAKGTPNPQALPGATPTSLKACLVAATGSLVILAGETWGEIHLGISEQQSQMTVFYGIYTLMAAFVEEIIFRGFLVLKTPSRAIQWAGALLASILFTALHPFLWQWNDGALTFTFTSKGWFSTSAVFLSSIWFYTVRLSSTNKNQSLIPSITAHATKNLTVFFIKLAQGFVISYI